MCIAVGVDAGGRSVLVHEGFGKPGRARTWGALGDRVAWGSTVVHDKEKARAVLVERLGLADEPHDARPPRGVPDELNPFEPMNRMCYMSQRLLRVHSGSDRADLQGYLDLLWVAMMNPPADKLAGRARRRDHGPHRARHRMGRDGRAQHAPEAWIRGELAGQGPGAVPTRAAPGAESRR